MVQSDEGDVCLSEFYDYVRNPVWVSVAPEDHRAITAASPCGLVSL